MASAAIQENTPEPYAGPERRIANSPPEGWLGPARRASDALAMPSFAHLAHVDRSVVAQQRNRLPFLEASPADLIPTATQARQSLGDDGLARLARVFVQGTAGVSPMATRKPDMTLGEMVQRGTCLDSELHDAFFGVLRRSRPDALVRAVTMSMAKLRAEARAGSLKDNCQDAAALADGLQLAFIMAAGFDPGVPRLPAMRRCELTPAAAARRWLRGHQIFLVLTQAMLVVLADLNDATPESGRLRAIETLAALMDASSAAMRLTGDFAPEIYDQVIRPTMAPPFMPDSFSGLFSSDHRMLVARLRELRGLLGGAEGRLADAHNALVGSFALVYDSHIAVCARFVGTDRKSLLMSDKANCDAIEQLEKFKSSRLRLLQKR